MGKRKNDLISKGEGSPVRPAWFENVNDTVGGLNYYRNCGLGDGFAPHVISSEAGCILIYPVDGDADSDEAAFNLEKAREMIAREEPKAEVVMAILLSPGVVVDKVSYEKRNIRCFGERQLTRFAKNYFSQSNEQLRLGKAAFRLGVYDYAFEVLTGVNVDNDADAQFMIGQMYAKGKGVKKDEKKAEEWYWKAAKQGLAVAALELEKIIDRETARLKRKQQELIDEIEEFARKLLEED